MLLSFIICLLAFVLIGVSAARKSRGTSRDYYLADQSVPPSLVGLSAVATNNSGYMFIGAIGYTYATGLASIWLMVGWIAGDFMASLYVHHKLRAAAAKSGESSYAGMLSNWGFGRHYTTLRRAAAVITLLFLLAYASAQLIAAARPLASYSTGRYGQAQSSAQSSWLPIVSLAVFAPQSGQMRHSR